MRRLGALLALGLALVWGQCALAAISSTVAAFNNTNSSVTTLVIPITSAVSAGDTLFVNGQWGAAITAITVSDNAGTGSGNCAGSYAQKSLVSANFRFGLFQCVATIPMTTGTTCGPSGTAQCAITLSWTTSTKAAAVALDLVEAGNTISYDSAGTGVTAIALTTGAPFTGGPTSPVFTGADEYLIGDLSLGATGFGATTTFTAPANGYATLKALPPAGTNANSLWVNGQAVTSGTFQLNGTFNNVTTGTAVADGVVWAVKATPVASSYCQPRNSLGVGC